MTNAFLAPEPNFSLSSSQLATLATLGEERTAAAGDVLYRVGERSQRVSKR